jgi:uncharacterized protein (DUF983 family)
MTAPESQPSALSVGLRAVCPRCGRGALFKSFVNIELCASCSSCGMSYKFIDTGDGPAWFAMLILSFVVLGGALYVEFAFEPGFWVHAVLWGVLTPVGAILLLRFLKATLIALQYRHRAEEGRPEGR